MIKATIANAYFAIKTYFHDFLTNFIGFALKK